MKKIMAFIFSLLIGFASFGAVQAAGEQKDLPELGGYFMERSQTIINTIKRQKIDVSKHGRDILIMGLKIAWDCGFTNSHACEITSGDGTTNLVLVIQCIDGSKFVFDYFNFICKWRQTNHILRNYSSFVPLDEYLRTNFESQQGPVSLQYYL